MGVSLPPQSAPLAPVIDTGDQAPRWLREFARFIRIKNLVFVYGNIYDSVTFPLRAPGSDSLNWSSLDDLAGFLRRYLQESGYLIVGTGDPVEALTFSSQEMEQRFQSVVHASVPLTPSGPRTASGGSAPQSGPAPVHTAPQSAAQRDPNEPPWIRYSDEIGRALRNESVPCAFVLNLASRFVGQADSLSNDELALFTRLLKASLGSKRVQNERGMWNNLLVLVCDKLSDVPAFLYLNNPRARSVYVELPDRHDRQRAFGGAFRSFFQAPQTAPSEELIRQFVDLTDGLTNYEISSLTRLSRSAEIPVCDKDGVPNVKALLEMYKYGVRESEWDRVDAGRMATAEAEIRKRVKGQEAAVSRVLDIVKRARLGLAAGESARTNRPRGVLFFAGPTGVGKTEMAKAIAALLFGKEDRLIRFDMSEYGSEHADQRLLGAPPGYVGYEEGGQLTNALKRNPFCILLFDEIEKAHGKIFDKFLQILDDGRLTDGRGETTYFSECLIIFTSNLGTVSQSDGASTEMLVRPGMPYAKLSEIILHSIHHYFNHHLGRPEILNRLGDNFVVFNFIEPDLADEITRQLIHRFRVALQQTRQVSLEVAEEAEKALLVIAREHLAHGGRGIRNAIDAALVNPLSRLIFDRSVEANQMITLEGIVDHGEDAATRFEPIAEIRPV
jgi:hypothetical protein